MGYYVCNYARLNDSQASKETIKMERKIKVKVAEGFGVNLKLKIFPPIFFI